MSKRAGLVLVSRSMDSRGHEDFSALDGEEYARDQRETNHPDRSPDSKPSWKSRVSNTSRY